MKNLTIGRVGLTVDLEALGSVSDSDTELTITGHTNPGSIVEAQVLRQQLLGYVGSSDEDFVPLTCVEVPQLDGFYRVRGVRVNANSQLYPFGVVPFSVELERVPNSSAPRLESVLIGRARQQASINLAPNPSGETSAANWVAIPGTSGAAAPTNPAPSTTTNYGTKVIRTQWSTASTAAGGGVYTDIPVREGMRYSFGLYHLKTSIANRMRMVLEWRTGGGSTISSVVAAQFQTTAGTIYSANSHADLKLENQLAPATATVARLRFESVAGTGYANWSIGSYLEVDGLMANAGRTVLSIAYLNNPTQGTAWLALPTSASQIAVTSRATGARSGPGVSVAKRKLFVEDECYVNYYLTPQGHYDGSASLSVGDATSVEYGWLTGRHDSASYRRENGVTTYNRAINPRVAFDSNGWSYFINTNGGTGVPSRIASSATGGWAYRVTWTVASTAIAGGSSFGFGAGSSDLINVTAGETIYPSIRVRTSIAQRIGVRVVFYDSSNNVIGPNLVGDASVTIAGQFATRQLGATVVPAGATRALIRASWESGPGAVFWGIGDTIDVSMVTTAPLPYWDGDDDNTNLRVVVGRQIENKPNNWLIDNGSVQVRPAYALNADGVRFQLREPGGPWRAVTFVLSIGVGGGAFLTPTTMVVLRNTPEQVTVRVGGVLSDGIDPLYPTSSPVTFDLTVRRGASFAAIEINTVVAKQIAIAIEGFASAIDVPFGQYLSANNMWVASPSGIGFMAGGTTVFALPAEATSWSVGVGFGTVQDFLPDTIDEYMWAGAERVTVVP